MTFVVVLNTQNPKTKLRSSMLIIKSDAQKQMVESGFGRRFHDLNHFEVGTFVHIPGNYYLLGGVITKLCGKPSIQHNLIVLQTNSKQPLVQYHLLAHHLHRLLKYPAFSWKLFRHHNLFAGFRGSVCFWKCLWFPSSQNSMLVSHNHLFNTTYLLAHHLHRLLKYAAFSWKLFRHHNLFAGFRRSACFWKCLWFPSSQTSMLVSHNHLFNITYLHTTCTVV